MNTVSATGGTNARLALIEFSDYQCPCAQHASDTIKAIRKNFVDSGILCYVFVNLPLESLHPFAVKTASAAESADSKTFSSDATVGSGTFGHFIGRRWTMRTMNEEHGFVEIRNQPARVGEKVWVVPSHVCPTVNLHDEVWYGRNGHVEGAWKVAARGKVR